MGGGGSGGSLPTTTTSVQHPLLVDATAVHTDQHDTSALPTITQPYRWKEERVIEPIKCMRLTTHQAYRWRGRESHRANPSVCAPHTPGYRWRGERVIEPIQCMLSPHISYRWRGERVIEDNQVSALTPHPSYRCERSERHRADSSVMRYTTPATGGEERET